MSFINYTQLDAMDCGATCLRMISKYYGKSYSNQYLREKSFITREGVSMLGISEAAENIGFRTQGVKISLEQLKSAPLPCISHWNQAHFCSVVRHQTLQEAVSKRHPLVLYFQAANFRLGMSAW
jgi:ATP-binding cassette subfamily B protein